VALFGAGCLDAESHAEEGATLYAVYCASCHGVGATGDGPLAGSLDPAPADLTGIALRNDGRFKESEVLATIDGRYAIAAHGTREMPVWGAVFREQHRDDPLPIQRGMHDARALVDYLRTLQREDTSDTSRARRPRSSPVNSIDSDHSRPTSF
jgi:mono/diheme cytochrome c family protein